MTTSISGTSGITFPNGSNQDVGAVGVGQTWQDVTSQRTAGTTYTNNTGKPIMVSFNNGANNTTITINGATVAGGGSYTSSQVIVPNGANYNLNGAFQSWFELR